jgi:DNA-binding FrmR family transcriptional regulator
VIGEAYVEAIIQAAERDASIARVLREICALDGAVRAGALELVGAHLRTHAAAADVLECVQALREDTVARRIAERLGPPG